MRPPCSDCYQPSQPTPEPVIEQTCAGPRQINLCAACYTARAMTTLDARTPTKTARAVERAQRTDWQPVLGAQCHTCPRRAPLFSVSWLIPANPAMPPYCPRCFDRTAQALITAALRP